MVVADRRAFANSGRYRRRACCLKRGAGLATGLVLAACSSASDYRSLHEVPPRPELAAAEQRLEIGDALLADRTTLQREGVTLRHETGKGPAPGPVEAAPAMARPAPKTSARRPENVEAAFVEERVRAETSDTSLGDFLRRVARLPDQSGDQPVAARAAGGLAGQPVPLVQPDVNATASSGKQQRGNRKPDPAPILDGLLASLGVAPQAAAPTASDE